MNKKQTKCVQNKMNKVMNEFKKMNLKSSSGKTVKNPKQAIAIGLNTARKSCKLPAYKPKKK